MNLESYYQRNSPIHRLSFAIKLCWLVTLGIVLCLSSNFFILTISLLLTISLYIVAKIPLKMVRAQLWSIGMVLIIVWFSYSGWINSLKAAIRFCILIFFSLLITLTTRTSDIMESIEKLLVFLSYFGLNHRKISLSLSLTLRFIPVIANSFQEVHMAQRARGIEHNFVGIIIPTVIKTLKMAENIAEAIEARSW
ncbi:energy-coupling factor transporter transmembrane component T family protein [Cardinium endosymbiont of Culicoides punctatus]|uniref:energy-coupling factor transporter transmembrane component T family protein n=1 Tax=Cardinium endosymbiont of Culicoides punctatus TaxID=2304601 RepID=UPI001058C814|nr:energy-coupling factor transporter transmembrane protein EcfT [Cardinium endosymbiont of Culicoides punctatus]TDG94183.1 Energy-coupling factor transporter transmembrane protein BioN [Cardinium endosymbiont of Culicoides punctatus]